jgi:hypothetical protein
MEPLDDDEIPLHSPRHEPLPLQPPVPPTTMMTGALVSASHRVAELCAASNEWEIMENEALEQLLCFRFRDVPHRYRIAGRLGANAALIIANLKNISKGSVLLETQHVKTFGENVERLRHCVRLPGPWMGDRYVEGLQQCIYMEDSNRYLYVFVTEESEVAFLLGVWIRELDGDGAGSEVEAVFEWHHTSPGLRTWASDFVLENVWMTAENLVEWAHYFTQNERRV